MTQDSRSVTESGRAALPGHDSIGLDGSVPSAAGTLPVPGALSVSGAMLVGTAALMILGVQPLLLGALTEEGRLSIAALGRLAMVEVLALAAGSAIGSRVMVGNGIRAKTASICLLLAITNVGAYVAHTPTALYLLRAAAGVSEGLALGTTIAILTHTRHPGRTNGLFLGLQTIPQMIAAYFLPVLILPKGGANAGFGVLGGLAFASILGAFWLRSPPRAAGASSTSRWHRSPAVLAALGAIIVQNAAIGGAWNYIEQVAADHQFGPRTVGIAMSGSLGCQVVGALFVAWIGWRAPYRSVLWIAITLQTLIVGMLTRPPSSAFYIAEACGFGLLWLALQPFQIRQLIVLDATREAVLLVTPLALLGLSLGPFCVSFAVKAGDVSGALWVAAGLFLLSAILFETATRLDDQPTPA